MREGDAPDVARLIEELGYTGNVPAVRSWIAKALDGRSGQIAYVASLRQEIVGWIEVSFQHRLQTEPFALIGGLVVKDGFRNQGTGRLLCEQAESWARQQGLKMVRVTSNSLRKRAHVFYQRNGYVHLKISHVFEKQCL